MTIYRKLISTGFLVSLLALSGCAASGKTQAHNMMVKGNNLILVPVKQKEDENCQKPLQIKADVSTKILNSGRALTIPVRIAGQPHDMIVDTGAAFSVIHNNVANSVGASREKMKTIYMVDSAGVTINEVATVSMFEMGGLFKNNFDFFITPDTAYAQEYKQVTKTPLAGLFGMDVLSRYDLELNTAKGVFRLLSQDHCPGKVVHWTDEYTVIPLLKRAVVGPSYIEPLATVPM